MIVTPHIIRSREITAEDLKPFYVGTANNLGAANAPALVSQVPPQTGVSTTPVGGTAAGAVTGVGATPPARRHAACDGRGASAGNWSRASARNWCAAAGHRARHHRRPARPAWCRAAGDVGADRRRAGRPDSADVPSTELQVGGPPYTVPVSITGVSDIGGGDDHHHLRPEGAEGDLRVAGDVFMQQGRVSPTFAPKIDEVAGRIDIAISRGANAPGAAGTGLLAGLVFQAVAPGSAKITVTGTAFTPAGQPITLQLPAASR